MNKTIASAVLAALAVTANAEIQEQPTSACFNTVTNLWQTGQQSNVLAIANARLATNQNDIVGLVLKANYDFENVDRTTLTNTLNRVLTVGANVNTPIFTRAFLMTRLDISSTLKLLAKQTDEKRAEDIRKCKAHPAPMPYLMELYALDQDGWLK